VGVCVF